MKNITDLEEYKLKKKFLKFEENKQDYTYHTEEIRINQDAAALHDRVYLYQNLNQDANALEETLHSNRHHFKFPTILSKYRKNIDVFSGLYMALQEALFKYEERSHVHTWTIDIFKDQDFMEKLIKKMNSDLAELCVFHHKYKKHYHVKPVKNKLDYYKSLREEYEHYHDIFTAVQDIEF